MPTRIGCFQLPAQTCFVTLSYTACSKQIWKSGNLRSFRSPIPQSWNAQESVVNLCLQIPSGQSYPICQCKAHCWLAPVILQIMLTAWRWTLYIAELDKSHLSKLVSCDGLANVHLNAFTSFSVISSSSQSLLPNYLCKPAASCTQLRADLLVLMSRQRKANLCGRGDGPSLDSVSLPLPSVTWIVST